MSLLLAIIILSILAFQVFPVALGSDIKKDFSKSILIILSMTIGQTLMLWLGIIVGQRFLHLTASYENIVIFISFFLIGLRIAMESFAIRKGERTYNSHNNQSMVLASVAQAINTFLGGLMFYYFTFTLTELLITISIASMLFSLIASYINLNKQSLAMSSFVYLISGIALVGLSIFLGFFSII